MVSPEMKPTSHFQLVELRRYESDRGGGDFCWRKDSRRNVGSISPYVIFNSTKFTVDVCMPR
jgi:hypothetical protein